ncbi:hypothetical protein HDV05_008647 [Chytridiales sp. JEL 0842]|nr:hypothetical protein HDV05_008647 [Chytridiales sp. JEL 0842]
MWTQLNALLPSSVRSKEFSSQPMVRREDRLKDARVNAERCTRNLQRDRTDLERKERALMAQIKQYANKGDLHKARIVAKQIAHYRSAADRNFEGATMIATRAQGIRHANAEDTLESTAIREFKYAKLMGMSEEMEHIMNDGMDEVYERAEESRTKRDYYDVEADNVLRQALAPKLFSGRPYIDDKSEQIKSGIPLHFRVFNPPPTHLSSSTTLNNGSNFKFPKTPTHPVSKPPKAPIRDDNSSAWSSISPVSSAPSTPSMSPAPRRVQGNPGRPLSSLPKGKVVGISSGSLSSKSTLAGATLKVPTLDLSVDMLKRLMIRDPYLLSQLFLRTQPKTTFDAVLGTSRPFQLGRVVYDEHGAEMFEPFDFVKSLKEMGIRNGGEIAVYLEDEVDGDEV